jgi:hypothetical protein
VVLPLGHLVITGMSFVVQYYSAYNANLKVRFWTSVFASSDQSEVGSSCGRRPVTEACARINDPELGVVELADMQNTVGAVARVEEDGVLGAQQTSYAHALRLLAGYAASSWCHVEGGGNGLPRV